MLKLIARLVPLLLLVLFHPGIAAAQQADHPPGLTLGDAVVTGFSGTLAPDPTKPHPGGKSAVDLTFINPDGPSARIIGIEQPGYVRDGRVFSAPKKFDVMAKDVGQVFGIALDDQAVPNVYLAASSAFGLQIISPGRDGQPERRKVGGPRTVWMNGQFGLGLQGDPGSIYRVDGTTGHVSLFAKVMLNGVPNPGPALGSLAYDAAHKQLFVSDLYTGMIHRFAIADGSEPGPPYDHGVTGRGAANLAPVPFNPGNRPNIASSRFNSENPDTWGFAPPERRVWGLAVHDGRLFYSARNGATAEAPQIWSVGIKEDGSFGADARLEVDVPAQPGPYAVSDIAFSQSGEMIVAQRAPIAASYDYSAFTGPGEPRVLRFSLKTPNDPNTPGRWRPAPDEYAVGFADDDRNTDGGVDLGYGYGPDGRIDTHSCESSIWITGENLRNDPALSNRLAPGGALVVHGLQGSDENAVRNANTPPWASYFVAYEDKFNDPRARGHLGVVRIDRVACGGPAAVVQREPGAPVAAAGGGGGGGGGGGACVCPKPFVPGPIPGRCFCPRGTALEGNECVPEICPPPTLPGPTPGLCLCPQRGGAPCKCPPPLVAGPVAGECVWPQQQSIACVSQACLPPRVINPVTGQCCPLGTVPEGRECVRRIECPPPRVINPVTGQCCPLGTVPEGRECVRRIECPPPRVINPVTGQCCPLGTVPEGKECVRRIECPPPRVINPVTGQCCPLHTVPDGKECVRRIEKRVIKCRHGREKVDGQCVKKETPKRRKRHIDQPRTEPGAPTGLGLPGLGLPGLGGGGGGGRGGGGGGGRR